MADELDVARERVHQQRSRDVAAVGTSRKLAVSSAERMGAKFVPGDRVIDLVTGEEAIVEGTYRETVHVPNAKGAER